MSSQSSAPAPKTPEMQHSFQASTPPPLPDSAGSSYFSRAIPGSSPARGEASSRGGGYALPDGSIAGKKKSFIGSLKSPSFTGVRSVMSDGWRRSSADAITRSSSRHEQPPYVTAQPRHGSASASTGVGSGGIGLGIPADRTRSVSDQLPYSRPHSRQASGMGVGFGDETPLDDSRSVFMPTEPPSEYASARTSMDGAMVPPPIPAASNARPRNVKNLSLPLSNMHGLAESLEQNTPMVTPSAESISPSIVLGTVAKGVRRKPVPQS